MNKDTVLNFDNLTLEQQQRVDDLFAGIQYLSEDAWAAVYAPELMTQELYDYIQLRRMKIGPELDNIAMDMFFKHPEFAANFDERLEKATTVVGYEAMRQGILDEFGYDIGASGKE